MPNYLASKLRDTTLAVVSLSAAMWAGASSTQPEQPAAVGRSGVPAELPAQGSVKFPSGEEVAVTFRPTPSEPMTPVNLTQYPALLAAAQRGNARSQAIVGRTMVYCAGVRGVPFSTPNTKNLAAIVQDRPNDQKEGTREAEVRQFCAQRSTEEIASGVEWLKAAAANGDTEAGTSLPSWYRSGSDEQVAALSSAWQQGSVTALHKLANAYWRRSHESGAESDDAINSLAAAWLHTKLNESAFREQDGSAFVDALRKDLARRFDSSSPRVQAEAIATARRMVSESDRCCSFP